MSGAAYIAGGVALLVGAHLLGKRQAAAAAPGGDVCEAARALGGESAVMACRAAKGLLGWVGDRLKSDNEDNVALNGPVTERVEAWVMEPLKRLLRAPSASDGMGAKGAFGYPLKAPFAIKYKNGCVPLRDRPGWELCAPGTFDMSYGEYWRLSGGDRKVYGGFMSGDPLRDLITFKWTDAHGAWKGPSGPGERWIVAGKPIVCPEGQTVNPGTDHRTIKGPPCAGVRSPVPVPGVSRPGLFGTTTTTTTSGQRNPLREGSTTTRRDRRSS